MDKRKKWLIGGFIVVGSVTALLWFKGRTGANEPIRVLEKNPPGAGDSQIHMEVRTEDGSFPVNFLLRERRYTEEELDQVFEQGKEWLDKVWLADNMSAENVTGDLYFPTQIE